MPGIEHHRRELERRLVDLESRLSVAERKAHEEGEIGRAVVGRWARRAELAAANARLVLAGFRREAVLRETRAGEPVARRARRFFTRDSPLLLRLKLLWELERALSKMDALLGDDDHHHHGVLPPPLPCRRERDTCTPRGRKEQDDEVKEAVVQAVLGDDDEAQARVLLIVGTEAKMAAGLGKSALASAVSDDGRVRGRFDKVAWRRVPGELEAAAVVRCAIASAKIRERELLGVGVGVGVGAAPGDEEGDAAVAGRRKRLLVVDGSWSDGERRRWEDDMMPRLRSCLGEHGSMVVVTMSGARGRGVASTIFR